MQGAGQQRPDATGTLDLFQVPRVAYATGAIHFSIACGGGKPLDQREVRPYIAADAHEIHRQQSLRPVAGRIRQQFGRPFEDIAHEVEGEHRRKLAALLARRENERCTRERFTADHRDTQSRVDPGLQCGVIGNPGIDPQLELRKGSSNAGDSFAVAATALDGVEIGDVQCVERMQAEQRADHGQGMRAFAQGRPEGLILCALAFTGVHDLIIQ